MANNEKKRGSIKGRQDKEKARFIEELKRRPNKSVAAKRSGMPRPTLYRWLSEDPQFAAEVNQAIVEGDELIDDMAEVQLISKIEAGHWAAIRYRLDRHPKYKIRKRKDDGSNGGKIKTLIMDI